VARRGGCFFGLLALLLGTIGLYRTMAYSVKRKTHEIGIRLALGAKPRDVLRMVLSKGLRLTFVGVVIGIVAALSATRFISTMIYGVTPSDSMTFV
jgi:ABC-type antimicrobial peptide transport system permease subunit